MSYPLTISYNGVLFKRAASKPYYRTGSPILGERYLHRVVWVEQYGAIPKNFCVHHKNHNALDNRIENMELVPVSEHAAYHIQHRLRNTDLRKNLLAFSLKNRTKLRRWSVREQSWGSVERKKHGKLAKQGLDALPVRNYMCLWCRKPAKSINVHSKYCSLNCCRQYNYRTKYVSRKTPNSTRNCLGCKRQFVSTWKTKVYCSKKCCSSRVYRKKVWVK